MRMDARRATKVVAKLRCRGARRRRRRIGQQPEGTERFGRSALARALRRGSTIRFGPPQLATAASHPETPPSRSRIPMQRLPSYPHPLIAREGWPFVAVALAVAIALSALQWWVVAALAWLAFAFVVQFFRDPPRIVPADANAVLSPADGRVVKVERARDPYLDRDALKISVFMNVFNVHSNRSPVDGRVIEAWYHRGTLPQRGARQGVGRERAQRAPSAHARRRRRHVRADRRADRAPDPLLREGGRHARARAALRLHPLRLARRRVPRPGGRAESRRGRRRLRDRDDPGGPAPADQDAQRGCPAVCAKLLPSWSISTPSARCGRIASAGAESTCCRTCSRSPRCSPVSTRSCRR